MKNAELEKSISPRVSLEAGGAMPDDLRAGLMAAVDEIAVDLACHVASEGQRLDASVAGEAALFFAYFERAFPGLGHERRARECLDLAFEGVSRQPLSAALHRGFVGVAWIATHVLDKTFEDGSSSEVIGDVVANLEAALSRSSWTREYDLVGGLAGHAFFALEAGAAGERCLGLIVDHLARTAVRSREGVWWKTEPAWLLPETRRDFPNGRFDLGVAHGLPALLPPLAAASAQGSATARELLQGATDRLLAHESIEDSVAAYPCWVTDDGRALGRRTAWCYGDSGVALTLLSAATWSTDAALHERARRVARAMAMRSPEALGVADACLCHGSAGLAHTFARMYAAAREPLFARAATFWLRETLRRRSPGRDGGFSSYAGPADGTASWVSDRQLLSGTSGVGLALLYALAPEIAPDWDGLLGVSLPSRLSLPIEVCG
jgi:hypothetical protein